jgi:predicted nuclease of predicted toxin-antitoxin system
MTFWLDAHLDPALCTWLGYKFKITAKALREIGLRDEEDIVLIQAAQRIGNIVIVTKDEDFSEYIATHGSPPQVLWLRCGNLSTLEMQAWLESEFPTALQRLQAGEACVEIPFTAKP